MYLKHELWVPFWLLFISKGDPKISTSTPSDAFRYILKSKAIAIHTLLPVLVPNAAYKRKKWILRLTDLLTVMVTSLEVGPSSRVMIRLIGYMSSSGRRSSTSLP